MNDLVRRDLGQLVARLTSDDVDRRQRAHLLGEAGHAMGAAVRSFGTRAAVSGRLLSDLLADDVVPHLPVRDLLTLREHHHGLSGDALAEALVRNAARVTAAVGAAAGALAAAEIVAAPALLAAPVQLAVETVVVTAVEVKLVAELHVVYGQAPKGSTQAVAAAYLSSWANRRPVDRSGPGPTLTSVVTAASKQQLRRRVSRSFRRNVVAFAPFLAGAAAGAELNRRETRALGHALQRELRRR